MNHPRKPCAALNLTPILMLGLGLGLSLPSQAADTVPQAAPASATAAPAGKATSDECAKFGRQKAGTGQTGGPSTGDGSNSPTIKKPIPPKCPQDIAKKVASPK